MSKPKLRGVKLGGRPIMGSSLPAHVGPGLGGLQVALQRVLMQQQLDLGEVIRGSNCFVGAFLPLAVPQGEQARRVARRR